MIEIIPPNQKKEEQKTIKRKKATKASHVQSSFSSALEHTIRFSLPDTVDELIRELKDHEEKLLSDPSLYNLQRYKALLRKIITILLSDEFVVTILERKRRDRADFVIIQKINTKLDEITQSFISKNKAFNLAKALDEIRGLIIDLTH